MSQREMLISPRCGHPRSAVRPCQSGFGYEFASAAVARAEALPQGRKNAFLNADGEMLLVPQKLIDTLASMFESRYRFLLTDFALNGGLLDLRYAVCWSGLSKTPQA